MQAYESVFNESIYFGYVPVPTFAGHFNRHPFKIVISSTNDNPHVVTLDSKYSKSYKPQKNKSKWSFLRPEVRFLDLNGNEIEEIITKDTKIYKNNEGILNTISGIFMGVSGYAEFYFVDDIYNYDLAIDSDKYSTIVAILQTSGINYFNSPESNHILSTDYSNSKAIAYQPHLFLYRDPDYIKISENGIRDFINPRWPAVNQYTIFTFNWNKEYTEFDINDGNGIMPIRYESNFNKSLPSNTNTDTISIKSNSNSIKIYYNDFLKLTYKDENQYLTPGYCKTFFNVASALNNVILSATSTFFSPDVRGRYYSTKLWLSNPNAGLISIVDYNNSTIFNLNSASLLKANIYNFEVPVVTPTYRKENGISNDTFEAGGYHSIDSIAVISYPEFKAWAIDSDLNYLYKFNTDGKILSAIDLLKLYNDNSSFLPAPIIEKQLSPTSIVLDGDQNIWITLYDNKYVLNLDSNGNFIYVLDLTSHITESLLPDINTNWYNANQSYPDIQNEVQEFVEPTFIDVDSENNLLVTYSNYASGYLAKFSRNNNLIYSISYPVCSCPQDLIVDNQDNVWIALSNNIWRSIGGIEKRDTNGNLLSSFPSIMGVNELTLDPSQNLWFTYSYSQIGSIDNITGEIKTFNVLDNSDFSKYVPEYLNPNINTDETILEGIACDLKGILFVINSIENRVYVYDTKTKKYINNFYVNPKGFTFWTPYEEGPTKIEYSLWNKSLQAHGDWMGTKWLNKFAQLEGTYQRTISGQSVPLNFIKTPSVSLEDRFAFLATTFYKYILTNEYEKIKVKPRRETLKNIDSFNLDFYKINENYDLASQIKSYAITPTLYESSYLFDKFFPSIYGSYPYNHYDLGIYSYEKISNYVLNHSDIDVCELNSLYSLADSIDNNTDDYMLNYPLEVKRLMDILSINLSHLLGSTEKNQNYFNNSDKNGKYNKGKLLTSTYNVTAGIPVVLKTKSLNKYELIQTGPLYITNQQNKITNSLNNFNIIISNNNNIPSTTPYGNINSTDESYQKASENILKYKSDLQLQVVEYGKYNFPNILNIDSLSAKCYRDVGYIIDAIAADILNNANHRSIDVADVYFKGAILERNTNSSTAIPTLPVNQVTATIQTIKSLIYYINGINIPEYPISFTNVGILSSLETGSSRTNDVYDRVFEIVYALQNDGRKRGYNPVGNPTQKDIELSYKLLENKEKIQNYVSAYVFQKKYLDVGPQPDPILSEKCKRDVGLMLDAVANDLIKGVVSKSIQYAVGYWDGSTSRLPENILPQQRINTIDTINNLNDYVISSLELTNAQANKITSSLNNFNRVILNRNDVPKTQPNGNCENDSYQKASEAILKYKLDLQLQIIKYAKAKYPNTLNTDTLSAKCYRDIGYVIEALAADILNNANHRSIDVGDVYFKGAILERKQNSGSSVPLLPSNQVNATINSIKALTYYINGTDIPTNTPSFTKTGILSSLETGSSRKLDVESRINNIIYPLQNNGLLNQYLPNVPIPEIDIELGNAIIQNKPSIQDYIANYVASKGYLIINPISPPPDIARKCKRDVGFMIDAVANDLKTGVVSKSIQYAVGYWDGSTSRLPENILPQQRINTIDVIKILQNYLLSVYFQEGITVTKNYDGSNEKLSTYPIQNLVNFIGINDQIDAWQNYYEFYEFIPTTNDFYSDNIIDWNNPQTTITNNITSVYDWLGDEKFIDTLFSYKFYTGLDIF
jgi:hypothetical protein